MRILKNVIDIYLQCTDSKNIYAKVTHSCEAHFKTFRFFLTFTVLKKM